MNREIERKKEGKVGLPNSSFSQLLRNSQDLETSRISTEELIHTIKMETEKQQSTVEEELRRGPWTVEEDLILTNHISKHGEGRWNSLAKCAGLKRTGKSCRLRWLNYLRPDLRRGNITAEEQLLIIELHSRWGNRWSKIARHLPGRTDNEIKNYWRTTVQKHANQQWMPRLLERIRTAAETSQAISAVQTASASSDGNSKSSSPPAANCCNSCSDEGGGAWVVEEERWSDFLTPGGDVNMSGFWELGEIVPDMYVK